MMQAPFPWFGGKSRVAPIVWERFGSVANYVEPFFGSGAVLLNRPDFDPNSPAVETVNDKDGLLCNFWRAIQHAPDEVARWADYPPNENDLHARHIWLVNQMHDLTAKLEGDPDYYDAKIAGWWVWGINLWIGSGWCSGQGPWQVVDGRLVKVGNNKRGVHRQLPHLGDGGRGVHRKRLHLGNSGRGVYRKAMGSIYDWFAALSIRLRRVRVASGDWSRVVKPAVLLAETPTAIFLDPPYSKEAARYEDLYREEDLDVAHEVRRWALEHGNNPKYRIALCGYTGEHDEDMLDANWTPYYWSTNGGYSNNNRNGNDNKHREVIWFSPHCLLPKQAKLEELQSKTRVEEDGLFVICNDEGSL